MSRSTLKDKSRDSILADYISHLLLAPGLKIPAVQAETFIEVKAWLRGIAVGDLVVFNAPDTKENSLLEGLHGGAADGAQPDLLNSGEAMDPDPRAPGRD